LTWNATYASDANIMKLTIDATVEAVDDADRLVEARDSSKNGLWIV